MRLFFKSIVVLLSLSISWIVVTLPKGQSKKNPKHIRIAVLNLHYQNPNGDILPKLVADIDADIAVLLEYSGENFNKQQTHSLGYRFIDSKAKNSPFGIALIAKSHIRGEFRVMPELGESACPFPSIAGRLDYNGFEFSLLGIHVPPPVPTCEFATSSTILDYADIIKDGKLKMDIGPAKKGGLVVVAGDLNVFPFDESLNAIKAAGMVDSYAAANWRPGPTWSPFSFTPAVARIDYIFASKYITIADSFTVTIPGSDHRGVVTDVVIL